VTTQGERKESPRRNPRVQNSERNGGGIKKRSHLPPLEEGSHPGSLDITERKWWAMKLAACTDEKKRKKGIDSLLGNAYNKDGCGRTGIRRFTAIRFCQMYV
jgi:hypothetical protein